MVVWLDRQLIVLFNGQTPMCSLYVLHRVIIHTGNSMTITYLVLLLKVSFYVTTKKSVYIGAIFLYFCLLSQIPYLLKPPYSRLLYCQFFFEVVWIISTPYHILEKNSKNLNREGSIKFVSGVVRKYSCSRFSDILNQVRNSMQNKFHSLRHN